MSKNWFKHQEIRWLEKAVEAENQKDDGRACYAQRVASMWRKFHGRVSRYSPTIDLYYTQKQRVVAPKP
jgi:hypothetical protein